MRSARLRHSLSATRVHERFVTENPLLDLYGPRNGDVALKVEAFAGSGIHKLEALFGSIPAITPSVRKNFYSLQRH